MKTFLRAASVALLLTLPIVFSSCGDGGGGTEPDPQPETLASFQLTVPDSVAEGEAFSLTVRAVGNRGTNPLTSYNGSVTLSTTLGTVTPTSLSVSNGSGTAQVTLSDPGQQTLAASGGGRTGSQGVAVTDLPDPTIPGDPQATLEQAVQDSVFFPDPDDYSNNHPELAGMYLSHNTILLVFGLGTTVEEANELLIPLGGQLVGAIQGIPGETPSILIVKLATATHQELEIALGTLRASPLVLEAVQDGLLGPHATPPDSQGNHPVSWDWASSGPGGFTDNLKLTRAPQMWNFNQALRKENRGTLTGIIDVGFSAHEDLSFATHGSASLGFHGTAVAGIIAAKYENDLGIEGINPFSDSDYSSGGLVAYSLPLLGGAGSGLQLLESLGNLMVSGLRGFHLARPEIRVINVSLGYNWQHNGVDPNTQEARDLVTRQGRAVAQIPQGLGRSPLIVVSAGNDNGLDARYGSPFTNAALEHGVPNILVVEGGYWDGLDLAHFGQSNLGGHIMAPGLAVFSTTLGVDGYSDETNGESHTGTSYAAAYVSGLAGYLLAADPTLTPAEVKLILHNNGTATGPGTARGIDAWASVMGIDSYRGGDVMLKMMLDIDDGTLDGNQRVRTDMVGFPDYDEEDADGDGGLGDGKIDMSDFRVWRDWFLKTSGVDADRFDGREDHPKMDVNDNGVTEDDAGESIYPRGDFNGDGILSLEALAFVPGVVQEEVSDLDVLKSVFDDPDFDKDALDTLVFSSDVTVDASIAFDVYTDLPIHAEMWQTGLKTLAQEFELTAAEPRKTFTVRSLPAGYIFEVRIGSASRFVNSFKVLATRPGTDAVVWPIMPHPVNVKSTFLTSCEEASPTTTQGISLQSLRVEPGDFLYLNAAWDSPHVSELVAVFSASDEVKVETEEIPAGEGEPPLILKKRTVTDAIAIGNDLLSGSTYASPPTRECGGVATDISQDFTTSPGSFVKIPDGATHIFFGMGSDYYDDNGSGNIRIRISKWYAPEWFPMPQPGPTGGQSSSDYFHPPSPPPR